MATSAAYGFAFSFDFCRIGKAGTLGNLIASRQHDGAKNDPGQAPDELSRHAAFLHSYQVSYQGK
jgi:hypothetical protein